MSGDGGGEWIRGRSLSGKTPGESVSETSRGEPAARGDLPVRLLIPASCVGAVLGQKGRVIRNITKESGARMVLEAAPRGLALPLPPQPRLPIDAHPHGPHSPHSHFPIPHGHGHLDLAHLSQERVISIWGEPEEASKAVALIQAIVREEAAKSRDKLRPRQDGREPSDDQDQELRFRGRHELIGRLIGKGGEHVKTIMAQTKATVSCAQELIPVIANGDRTDAYGPIPGEVLERTISIRGSSEAIFACEKLVNAALRDAWRNLVPRHSSKGPYGPLALHLPPHPQPFLHQAFSSPLVPPYLTLPPLPLNANLVTPLPPEGPAQTETVYLYVPANIVGALIGPKGAHIRNLMRMTGAQVRVEGGGKAAKVIKEVKELKEEEEDSEAETEDRRRRRGESEPAAETTAETRPVGSARSVLIVGGAESQLRAQFWVYQRVCEWRQAFLEEVKLTAECPVAAGALGRVIGRQGAHLKDLARTTLAELHVLKPDHPDKSALLRITGSFNASQACQARLRSILAQFHSSHAPHVSENK